MTQKRITLLCVCVRVCVAVPRQPGHNQVWEFDIELGNTAEASRDDPGECVDVIKYLHSFIITLITACVCVCVCVCVDVAELHCAFDGGLCDWLSDREGDLHWEVVHAAAGHTS